MPSVHVNDATYQRILAHRDEGKGPLGELKGGVIIRALDALEKLERICTRIRALRDDRPAFFPPSPI